jgi:hypothetical protein
MWYPLTARHRTKVRPIPKLSEPFVECIAAWSKVRKMLGENPALVKPFLERLSDIANETGGAASRNGRIQLRRIARLILWDTAIRSVVRTKPELPEAFQQPDLKRWLAEFAQNVLFELERTKGPYDRKNEVQTDDIYRMRLARFAAE